MSTLQALHNLLLYIWIRTVNCAIICKCCAPGLNFPPPHHFLERPSVLWVHIHATNLPGFVLASLHYHVYISEKHAKINFIACLQLVPVEEKLATNQPWFHRISSYTTSGNVCRPSESSRDWFSKSAIKTIPLAFKQHVNQTNTLNKRGERRYYSMSYRGLLFDFSWGGGLQNVVHTHKWHAYKMLQAL